MSDIYEIARLASLISEDDMVTPNDIGTPEDVGDAESEDEPYTALTSEDDLNSIAGIAKAIVSGSLRDAVLRGLSSENIMLSLLERTFIDHGSIEAAVEHLSFSPEDDDMFDGARLEIRNNVVLGYNGYEGKQYKQVYSDDDTLARAFIAIGARILPGMCMSLLERRKS